MTSDLEPSPWDRRNAVGLDRRDADLIAAAHADPGRPELIATAAESPAPFIDLLASRRSSRALKPCDANDLLALIASIGSPATRTFAPDGYVEERRPYPSAGARHPHTLLLLVSDVVGISSGSYVVSGGSEVSLWPIVLSHDTAALLAAIRLAGRLDCDPPASLVTVANFRRTTSKYEGSWGHSLVWRDAGALQQTIHLAAHCLGLASSIVGITETVRIPIPGSSDVLRDTGAVVLGRSAD
jgi:SagB-type dehydrogenase family enzyme